MEVFFMFYTYILDSTKPDNYFNGITDDELNERIRKHILQIKLSQKHIGYTRHIHSKKKMKS